MIVVCPISALMSSCRIVRRNSGIRFIPANKFGVLDHVVTLPDGQSILNPMRVVANGDGSEVMFTLFQISGMSDEQFANDSGMVESDLLMLKSVLESHEPAQNDSN